MRWDHTIFQVFFQDHYKIVRIYPGGSKFQEYSRRVIILGLFQERKNPATGMIMSVCPSVCPYTDLEPSNFPPPKLSKFKPLCLE